MITAHLEPPEVIVRRQLPETVQDLELSQKRESRASVRAYNCRRPPAGAQKLDAFRQWFPSQRGPIVRTAPAKVHPDLVHSRQVVKHEVLVSTVAERTYHSGRVGQLNAQSEIF